MIPILRNQIASLAPHARREYLMAFDLAGDVLTKYLINATALRVAHFVAQVMHETGGLTILTESLNYSPKGLLDTFGEHRISQADAEKYGRTPEHLADQRAIANIVYGGEFGRVQLGNTAPDDGWNLRGTGMLQMTGRESRKRIGAAIGVDLITNPDVALEPRNLLLCAAEEWNEKGCNVFADRDKIETVTERINGGRIGLASRENWLNRTKKIWVYQ